MATLMSHDGGSIAQGRWRASCDGSCVHREAVVSSHNGGGACRATVARLLKREYKTWVISLYMLWKGVFFFFIIIILFI